MKVLKKATWVCFVTKTCWKCLLDFCFVRFGLEKNSIVRNAKDTAHTKAERNILECVKVKAKFARRFSVEERKDFPDFSVRSLSIWFTRFKREENFIWSWNICRAANFSCNSNEKAFSWTTWPGSIEKKTNKTIFFSTFSMEKINLSFSFYLSEILLGLEHLHKEGIIYRFVFDWKKNYLSHWNKESIFRGNEFSLRTRTRRCFIELKTVFRSETREYSSRRSRFSSSTIQTELQNFSRLRFRTRQTHRFRSLQRIDLRRNSNQHVLWNYRIHGSRNFNAQWPRKGSWLVRCSRWTRS